MTERERLAAEASAGELVEIANIIHGMRGEPTTAEAVARAVIPAVLRWADDVCLAAAPLSVERLAEALVQNSALTAVEARNLADRLLTWIKEHPWLKEHP